MSAKEWTDELKAQVVADYEAAGPTAENTMEIVADLAEKYEKTRNGVRMILTKKGVYVKKTVAKASTSTDTGDKPKRVNKAEAIANLKKVIGDAGKDVDDDICDRLTGKAAVYIAGLLG